MKIKIPDIIKLSPNRVWRTYLGGRQLDRMASKTNPQDSHFPEDWIASTTMAVNKGREDLPEEGLSLVQIDGQTYLLRDLFQQYPHEFLGKNHFEKYGPNSQFLLKFLDSSIRLHIQAHPSIPFAKKYLNSNSGKTEAYYILNNREEVREPYIYLGFQRPPEPEDFKRMIIDQDTRAIISCFEKIPVKAGDTFIVPGGLPHAIGEGVMMIEIMEPTDLVVRLEFECGGYVLPQESRFMGRNIDFAISMLNFDQKRTEDIRREYFIKPRELQREGSSVEYSLIDDSVTSCFGVKKVILNGGIAKQEDSFYVGIVTRGRGRIHTKENVIPVMFGDRFLIPFYTGIVNFESDETLELVLTLPPSPCLK